LLLLESTDDDGIEQGKIHLIDFVVQIRKRIRFICWDVGCDEHTGVNNLCCFITCLVGVQCVCEEFVIDEGRVSS